MQRDKGTNSCSDYYHIVRERLRLRVKASTLLLLLIIAVLASINTPHISAQHQTLGFFIDPSDPCTTCTITIRNSTISDTHTNNTFAPYDNGLYYITANSAGGFSFQTWSVTGGLSLYGSTGNPTQVTVSGSGNIIARFTPSSASLTCGSSNCAVVSNATIAQTLFYSGNHTLIVTFSGPTGTVSFSNVTVPKSDVFNSDPSSITVFLNNTKLPGTAVSIKSNATDFFVYITFTFHSGVRAEYVFFPLSAGLPLYLGVALVLLTAPIIISTRARFKNRPR